LLGRDASWRWPITLPSDDLVLAYLVELDG
jgi:hypothetical protein